MPRLAAPLLAVLALSLQAALGPGAEIPVAPVTYGFLTGPQETVMTATDGTDFLALWRDGTPGRDGVYATIVRENGETHPLAPEALIRGYVDRVTAVWTGDSYLVVFTPYLEPSLLVRLNRDGGIVAPLRPIDGGPSISALAWNGSRVLAITHGASGPSAALLDADGDVVRSGIQLPAGIHDLRVNAAGSSFILVWTERLSQSPMTTRVHATRISAEGGVSAPVELMAPTPVDVSLDTASRGTQVGVVVRSGSAVDTVIRRYVVSASLDVGANAPLTLAPFVVSNVEVVATPYGFAATYFALNNDRLKTIAFGSTTSHTIELPWSPGYGLLTESNGRAVLAFWGAYPVRAAIFDASVTRMTSSVVSVPTAPAYQGSAAIASSGSTGLVAWVELGILKVRRIDGEGAALDAEPLTLGPISYRPAIVFTGQLWLVAWVDDVGLDGSAVKVQRVSSDGVVLGEPVSLDMPSGDLAFASNRHVAALVSSSYRNRQGIWLLRFAANGERIDSAPIVLSDLPRSDSPAIASNGDGFLVAWSRSSGFTSHLYAKRLDASANPMDAEPIVIANRADVFQGLPAVASNGTDYVVAYVQARPYAPYDPPLPDDPGPEPHSVFTKRVLATGVLADTTPDQDGTRLGEGTNPEITFDGSGYAVTFTSEDADTLSLFAVSLDSRGKRASATRLLVRAESYSPDHGIARIGGALWTTYSRVVGELTSVHRVFLREVTEQQVRRRGARH